MGRAPCCEKDSVKRGPWTPEEDAKLLACVAQHGTGSWRNLPKKAGLQRCGKSCRLRWTNYLRPDLKHGRFSEQEEQMIVKLHAALGSRWSLIAAQLPGRTDNDVKNYWNTRLKKKLCEMGIDPITHKPISQLLADLAGSMATTNLPNSPNNNGGSFSASCTSTQLADATLGCFKDDMLSVMMRGCRLPSSPFSVTTLLPPPNIANSTNMLATLPPLYDPPCNPPPSSMLHRSPLNQRRNNNIPATPMSKMLLQPRTTHAHDITTAATSFSGFNFSSLDPIDLERCHAAPSSLADCHTSFRPAAAIDISQKFLQLGPIQVTELSPTTLSQQSSRSELSMLPADHECYMQSWRLEGEQDQSNSSTLHSTTVYLGQSHTGTAMPDIFVSSRSEIQVWSPTCTSRSSSSCSNLPGGDLPGGGQFQTMVTSVADQGILSLEDIALLWDFSELGSLMP